MLNSIFFYIGLMTIGILVKDMFLHIFYRIKFGTWKTTILEEKYLILREENKNLKKKLEEVEREKEEIIKKMIAKISS